MAEKKLDIKVAASQVGVEQTTASVRKLGEEVRRAQDRAARGAGPARGGGPQTFGGFLGGLNRQAQAAGIGGEGSFVGLLRGGGALFGVNQVGIALQALPDELGKFRSSLRTGGTVTEGFASVVADTIPVVGNLAKGFRGLFDFVSDLVTGRDRQREEQERADARAGAVTRQRRDAKREGILFDVAEETRKERGQDRVLSFQNEFNRQRAEIENEFREKMLELDRKSHQRSALSPDQQLRFDQDIQQQREFARRRRTDRTFDVDVAQRRDEDEVAELERQRRDYLRGRQDKRREFDIKLFQLQDELLSDLGGIGAVERERLKIKRDTKEQELEIARQLRDPAIDETRRQFLRNLMERLPALERERLGNVRVQEPPNRTQLESTRFLTGVGPRDSGRATEKNTEQAVKILRMIYDLWRRLTPPGATQTTLPPFP